MDLDLANIRDFGIRSLRATCKKCFLEQAVNVDAYPGEMKVQWFAERIVCQNCGEKIGDVQPNWIEQP